MAETAAAAVDVAIVGAGPCGLAAAIFCRRVGLSVLAFDRGPLVSGVAGYPTWMTFFSTAERIAIADVPFPIATEKPTRRDALAYYRLVAQREAVPLRLWEEVVELEPLAAGAGGAAPAGARAPRFRLRTRTVPHGEPRETLAHAVVVATGYFGRPSLLGVPGEELPHVSHFFTEGHRSFGVDVAVIGGGNSAVDAALELWRAGARRVTMVHFGAELDPNVKPWVRPDIEARIREGSIAARFNARVARIGPHALRLRDVTTGEESTLEADHVYAMTGFLPNTGLLERLGVPLDAADGIPAHDPATMETSVPGVFIAGVIASGNHANRIFIENGRDHGRLIAAALVGMGLPSR